MNPLNELSVERGFERLRVLVVDDDDDVRLGLELLARSLGVEVQAAANGEEALDLLRMSPPHLLLSDITMPGISGMELLRRVRAEQPQIRVLMITGYGTIELAVEAMRRGAVHFITKPFDNQQILAEIVRQGCEALIAARIRTMESSAGAKPPSIVAMDPRSRELMDVVRQVAPTTMPVLLRGENGTGKTLIAKAIHEGRDAALPFVSVPLAALSDVLLGSRLSGHMRGAFAGAESDQEGAFAATRGGTVYLQGVGTLPLPLQAKLLRILQERTVIPLGSTTPRPVQFRLVSATTSSLREKVEAGAFREDLLYRLRVVTIEIPPLRERPGDIVPLALHFIARYAQAPRDEQGRLPTLTPTAMETLQSHPWPGNVRELENSIQRALVLARGESIDAHHLRLETTTEAKIFESVAGLSYEDGKQRVLQAFQRRVIEGALRATAGNVTHAADHCGLTRAAFQRIMRSLDLDRTRFTEEA